MTHRHSRGFGLVELMVALAISLVLFGGAIAIYLSSKGTYVDNERLSRVQETGRIALDLLARDVRAAGFTGCMRTATFSSVLNDASDPMLWDFTRPLAGYNGTGSAFATAGAAPAFDAALAPDADENSDVLVVRGPLRDGPALTLATRMNVLTDDVALDDPPAGAIAAGDIAFATDCRGAAVFQVTGIVADALKHEAGGSFVPGNTSAELGRALEAVGSVVLPLQVRIYYLAPPPAADCPAPCAERSLWRREGSTDPLELLRGVERMQLQYGLDPNEDGVVESYVNATGVTNWNRVAAVRVALLVRSETEEGTIVDTRTYALLDAAPYDPADDRRLREVFTTTATLRNRAP